MSGIKKTIIAFASLAALYALSAFTECPILSDARNIWIETAMTTGEHQWLAALYPQFVVRRVMSRQVNAVDGIAGLSNKDGYDVIAQIFSAPSAFDKYGDMACDFFQEVYDDKTRELEEAERSNIYWTQEDPLHQLQAEETGFDDTGREVLHNDIEQGIMISKVRSVTYVGYVIQICDPSRVFIAATEQKEKQGKLICDYLEEYNAILGINASGFRDDNGNGLGGEVIGRTRIQGEDWGSKTDSMTLGFDNEDRLIAGQIDDWDQYHLRDAIQFEPVLIKDGSILTEGSAGWGLQPRTIVGQRADGAVLFMVVDGRKPGYSIGATMGDCAEVLLEYGAVTAAACDGGSSSVLAYNGDLINIPSTPMETGRYLPNAFLVRRR